MSKNSQIEHSGIVLEKHGNELRVQISQNSACGTCGAAKLCNSAESKTKEVDVLCAPGEQYAPGDEVLIVGNVSLGAKAVILAYVVPLIIMVAAVFIAKALDYEDGVAGIAGLLSVVPYFIILFLLRDRLNRVFKFTTKKPIK